MATGTPVAGYPVKQQRVVGDGIGFALERRGGLTQQLQVAAPITCELRHALQLESLCGDVPRLLSRKRSADAQAGGLTTAIDLKRSGDSTPLCPAGHLPLKGGDRMS